MKHAFIKSHTINRDLCKQYLYFNPELKTLAISKLVLVPNNEDLYSDWELVKKFKDYNLFKTNFSIKISTLNAIQEWINPLTVEEFYVKEAEDKSILESCFNKTTKENQLYSEEDMIAFAKAYYKQKINL